MTFPSTHITLLCELRERGCRDEAWTVFHARYRGVIFGWCLHRGLSPHDAEDLTQDILLKLFQQLPQYRYDPARGQFRGWLKTIVNNTLIDFWRQQQQPGRLVVGAAFPEEQGGFANPEAAAELSSAIEDHAQAIAAEVLQQVRAKVKETTWQAFYQMMVEQRPAAEVAEELKLSIATVYKSNYRVKQMLLQEYRHVHAQRGERDLLPGSGNAGKTPA